jgi:hypothetical protein
MSRDRRATMRARGRQGKADFQKHSFRPGHGGVSQLCCFDLKSAETKGPATGKSPIWSALSGNLILITRCQTSTQIKI